MDRLLEVDRDLAHRAASSRAARARGSSAGSAPRALTLGHFPQSFEYSTVGGWVATRSAGQASTGYGRIDELVEGVRCIAPAGRGRRPARVPASAAGPCLRELLVGSEGVLGVICEATLRVRPAARGAPLRGLVVPAASRRAARPSARWSRRDAAAGRGAALRRGARRACRWRWRSTGSTAASGSGGAYLRLRGHEGGCIAIVGFEGERGRRRAPAAAHAGAAARRRRCRARPAAGARPGCAAASPRPTCATSCSTAA